MFKKDYSFVTCSGCTAFVMFEVHLWNSYDYIIISCCSRLVSSQKFIILFIYLMYILYWYFLNNLKWKQYDLKKNIRLNIFEIFVSYTTREIYNNNDSPKWMTDEESPLIFLKKYFRSFKFFMHFISLRFIDSF